MRIIAGEFRSRKLLSPPEEVSTRPIPDRVKESLFGILRGHLEGAHVFDAFAGTGAVGLEAVSRGAARCVMIEKDRLMAGVLQKNVDNLGVRDRCEVVIGDALGAGALARCPRPCTIVMMDPPYALMRDPLGAKRIKAQLAALVQCLSDDGFAVLRTPWPLFYAEEEAVVAPPPGQGRPGERAGRRAGSGPPRAARLKKPTAKGRWDEVWTVEKNSKQELDEMLEDAGEGPDEPIPESPESPAIPAPAAPAPPKRFIDLAIEGAVGPETHEYGTMAIHLYMRKR